LLIRPTHGFGDCADDGLNQIRLAVSHPKCMKVRQATCEMNKRNNCSGFQFDQKASRTMIADAQALW
jgi:hypothetical protein